MEIVKLFDRSAGTVEVVELMHLAQHKIFTTQITMKTETNVNNFFCEEASMVKFPKAHKF